MAARSHGSTNAGKPFKFRVSVVAGAAADTNIALTGFKLGKDNIVSVVRFDLDATAANIDVDDLTSELQAVTDGNFQLSTTVTTGDKLVVFWQQFAKV